MSVIMTEEMYQQLARTWGCTREQISRDGEYMIVTTNGEPKIKCSFVDALKNLLGAKGEWN